MFVIFKIILHLFLKLFYVGPVINLWYRQRTHNIVARKKVVEESAIEVPHSRASKANQNAYQHGVGILKQGTRWHPLERDISWNQIGTYHTRCVKARAVFASPKGVCNEIKNREIEPQ